MAQGPYSQLIKAVMNLKSSTVLKITSIEIAITAYDEMLDHLNYNFAILAEHSSLRSQRP